MRPRRAPPAPLMLTRRALARGLAIGAAAMGLPVSAAQAAPAIDPALRDAALRGLALAGHRGDPVSAAAARAAIDRLAETDPEGALLARLYRKLDVRPAAYSPGDMPAATPEALAVLHAAIGAARPVFFGYTDLSDQVSERAVQPLALVHPPQGVKLLAYCEARGDYRQFFVRAMRDLAPRPGGFAEQRMALLQGLAEKEGA
ncbi:MAG: WYL domain-containing protein [Gemmobacter sp.]|nr:WYL domain-containing protein [Gemmobacter sp.]